MTLLLLTLASQVFVVRCVCMASVDAALNAKEGFAYPGGRPSFNAMIFSPKLWLLWTLRQWEQKYAKT